MAITSPGTSFLHIPINDILFSSFVALDYKFPVFNFFFTLYLLIRLEVNVLFLLKDETLNQFELGMTVACFSFLENFAALFGYFAFGS